MSFFLILLLFWGIFVLLSIYVVFFHKKKKNSSSYECGFSSLNKYRLFFCLPYFSILLVFLIFDLELVILNQLIFENSDFLYQTRFWYFIIMLFLILATYEEYRRGLLSWL